MGRIIGIDLGTTNSVVSVVERNGAVVVPNGLGDRLTPSVVGFSKSGEILIGKKAKRAAAINTGRTVTAIKRQMGSGYRVKIEGKDYTPQEISAMIVQKLKQDTEDFFGEEITDAVLTVPAYFTDAQRQATKDAGEIAGFNVRRIIDEPTAAAIAYGLEKGRDQVIAVFDLGGGTFDVSIIDATSGVFRVLAIHGDTKLGGEDFDERIVDYLLDEFQKTHGVDLSADPVAMTRIKEAAEEAKIDLSEISETTIVVEAVAMGDSGPITLQSTLTREKFESLIGDLVQRTIQPMQAAIEDSGIPVRRINTVLLVGGSTRIPLVQRIVKETLGANPARDVSPDEVVALGAAIQAIALGGIEEELEGTLSARYGVDKPVIIHTTPFSMGIGLEQDQFSALIERNSTYPTEAKDIFTTTRDFQETISFPVYEGEGTLASENAFLDLLRIEAVAPAPRGVPRIEVTFRLNPDRILEVSAEDLATGKTQSIRIESTSNRLDENEKNRMIKESRERVATHLRKKIKISIADEAEEVISRAESLVATLDGHPRGREIRTKIVELRSCLDSDDSDRSEDLTGDLLEIVAELESAAG